MKKVIIILVIVLGVIALFTVPGIAINNAAISKENSITELYDNITITVKARNDALTLIVDSIESYNGHEQAIIDTVTEASNALASDNFEQVRTIVTDLFTNYPDIYSAELYETFNKEVSIRQNRIEAAEKTYNKRVNDYKTFVRTFPNTLYLSILGYEVIDIKSLNYEDEMNKPLPSFGE